MCKVGDFHLKNDCRCIVFFILVVQIYKKNRKKKMKLRLF